MSLDVRIPKEIMEYHEKIIFSFSWRQLATIGVAIATCGVTAWIFLGVLHLNADIMRLVITIEAIPFALYGFIKPHGMDFEKWIMIVFQHRFGTNKLAYKTELPNLHELNSTTSIGIESKDKENELSKKEKKARKKQRARLAKQPECLGK